MGVKTKTLEEALAKFIDSGSKPYAFLCNKETFKKIALEMRECSIVVDFGYQNLYRKIIPSEMRYDGIFIFEEKYVPKDKIYIVDKEAYLKIKKVNEAFWDKNKKIMIDAAGKYRKDTNGDPEEISIKTNSPIEK